MTNSPSPLAPAECAQLLRFTAEVLRAGLTTAPLTFLEARPAPEEWCIKEVLGHIIEAEERGFAGRIHAMLEGDEPRLQGWDQEAVARARGDCQRELRELLDEFIALRERSIDLVSALGLSDLERGGLHPLVGRLTVRELLQEWIYHDQIHLRQMLANLQRFVWPHMGNARRFYEE